MVTPSWKKLYGKGGADVKIKEHAAHRRARPLFDIPAKSQ